MLPFTSERLPEKRARNRLAKTTETTVLLVHQGMSQEDKALEIFLASRFHHLFIAKETSEGILMAVEYSPEIIVVDLDAYGQDALNISRLTKAGLIGLKAFVISLSAKHSADLYKTRLDAGVDAQLIKPNSLPELLGLIAETLVQAVDAVATSQASK